MLCSPGWSHTCSNPPASVSQALGLEVYVNMSAGGLFYLFMWFGGICFVLFCFETGLTAALTELKVTT